MRRINNAPFHRHNHQKQEEFQLEAPSPFSANTSSSTYDESESHDSDIINYINGLLGVQQDNVSSFSAVGESQRSGFNSKEELVASEEDMWRYIIFLNESEDNGADRPVQASDATYPGLTQGLEVITHPDDPGHSPQVDDTPDLARTQSLPENAHSASTTPFLDADDASRSSESLNVTAFSTNHTRPLPSLLDDRREDAPQKYEPTTTALQKHFSSTIGDVLPLSAQGGSIDSSRGKKRQYRELEGVDRQTCSMPKVARRRERLLAPAREEQRDRHFSYPFGIMKKSEQSALGSPSKYLTLSASADGWQPGVAWSSMTHALEHTVNPSASAYTYGVPRRTIKDIVHADSEGRVLYVECLLNLIPGQRCDEHIAKDTFRKHFRKHSAVLGLKGVKLKTTVACPIPVLLGGKTCHAHMSRSSLTNHLMSENHWPVREIYECSKCLSQYSRPDAIRKHFKAREECGSNGATSRRMSMMVTDIETLLKGAMHSH
ncbi:hypothetical protein BDW22DRAFT_338465 [Trametopsis cervina]|nr:hypothetical protein BDW22DRAFT_338465 [Trametopsis cervina]